MNRTLVALSAITVTVLVVALFAFAQTVFDGNVQSTGTITGTTITATTGFVGDLTGDVTGVVFQTVATQGALPAAADNTGECFMNTTGDSGWVADNDSYVQLWP